MIRIDRSGVAAPSVLVDDDAAAARELDRARTSLAEHDGDPADWKFSFSVYSNGDVKTALSALFHGKCAYCESRYDATQPMDVEHWRPKGRVETADGTKVKPAYWWLAAAWTNLLPSCIDCNRRRWHTNVVTDAEEKLGKEDQFPLLDDVRADAEGAEADERPALINPCVDDPADFFEFTEEAVIKPREGLSETDTRRAFDSIRVYALNRAALVEQRQETLLRAQMSVAIVHRVAEMRVEQPDMSDEIRMVVDRMVQNEFVWLATHCRDDAEYALMVRQLVDRDLAEFSDALADAG